MPTILAVLCSGRRRGYTAGLLEAAARAAQETGEAEVDLVCLHDFDFKPCVSCFACIRGDAHRCPLDDDMGRDGDGALMRKLLDANALLIADPVHLGGPSAMCHLFFERMYPLIWSRELAGMPFMSISCAANQGMQRAAQAVICKWAFDLGLRWTSQIAAHAFHYDDSLAETRAAAKLLAQAAAEDAGRRRPFADEVERLKAYLDKPWNPLEFHLDNLTAGTRRWRGGMIEQALKSQAFQRPDAVEQLQRAAEALRACLQAYRRGDLDAACERLAECRRCWSYATWAEFLEDKVIGAKPPARPAAASPPDPQPAAEPGREELLIHVDGASRGNPGQAAAGVVICNRFGQPVERIGKRLGRGTNNYAEYQALLLGLRRARELGAARVRIRSDSELLVRQTKGEYQVKAPQLKPLARQVRERLAEFESWAIEHAPRGDNAEADRMANLALDRERDVTETP